MTLPGAAGRFWKHDNLERFQPAIGSWQRGRSDEGTGLHGRNVGTYDFRDTGCLGQSQNEHFAAALLDHETGRSKALNRTSQSHWWIVLRPGDAMQLQGAGSDSVSSCGLRG